jgi:hypothetical protein
MAKLFDPSEGMRAMTSTRPPLAIIVTVGLVGLLISPREVVAQAWVPEKGEGAVAVAFQELNVKKHLATTTSVDAGHINSVVLLADMTYGLTDKIAVDLAVPFVTSKYSGAKPHPGTDIDNGQFHGTLTDVRFSVRYNLYREGAVITPYIGSIVPSHDYQFYGHAAAGERLNELQVGAYVAKLFTRGVPGMFVSGRYGYGFVERVADIKHNRSVGDLELGYFLTPSLRAFGMANAQRTHGGIDFPAGGLPAVPLAYKQVHDVIQRVNYLNLGGGVAYSINDSVDVFGSFLRLAAGRNGHALNRGITLGASWSFSRHSKAGVAAGAGAPASEYVRLTAKREGSLGRCICQKSGM